MLRWMCRKTRHERVRNDNIRERERVGIAPNRKDGGN